MQKAKRLVESKTFQVALLQAFLGAVVIFNGAYPGVGWLAIIKSILDISIRLETSLPIEGTEYGA